MLENIELKCRTEIGRIRYTGDNDFIIFEGMYNGNRMSFKGCIPGFKEDNEYDLTGTISDSRYGKTFSITSSVPVIPTNREGIIKYMQSNIKHIGKSTAEKIYDRFGEDTLRILEEDPERLQEVKGIGSKNIVEIAAELRETAEKRNIIIWLQSNGASALYADRIYNLYKDKSCDILQKNPYVLTNEDIGVGFKLADKIARCIGIAEDDPRRIQAAIMFYMTRRVEPAGDCYVTAEALYHGLQDDLQVDIPYRTFGQALKDESYEGRIALVSDPENGLDVYRGTVYRAERKVASALNDMISDNEAAEDDDGTPLSEDADVPDIEYNDTQKEAIDNAGKYRISILTGGPGTGKTTTLRGMIKAMKARREKVLLAAPTGRAAKRMTEQTGKESKTIHRLLEYKPFEKGRGHFERNAKNPLEGDVLIIDEASMIDIQLMASLVDAIPDDMRLVIVGDIDQLPSVGCGNVLRDMIESGSIPVTRLEFIYRKEQDSGIAINAHHVNNGELPEDGYADYEYIHEKTDADFLPVLTEKLNDLHQIYGYDLMKDIQILTPVHDGPLGTENLNLMLQNELNADGKEYTIGRHKYRVGDKVMQTKNDYDLEVFNGDIGYIREIDKPNKTVYINFSGELKAYDFSDMSNVTLAYAVTIHKSQGSEYKCVIMFLSNWMMMQRNLLYTGITRAKSRLLLMSQHKYLMRAVANAESKKRATQLKKLIRIISGKNF